MPAPPMVEPATNCSSWPSIVEPNVLPNVLPNVKLLPALPTEVVLARAACGVGVGGNSLLLLGFVTKGAG